MKGELVAFPSWQKQLSPDQARPAIDRILATPVSIREDANEPALNDPEVLLGLCLLFRSKYETSPSTIRDEAEFFYRYLSVPGRCTGSFDEREYFLGEFAMIAGTASRFLFRRDEARRWFNRSEASFVLAQNSSSNFARLAYQRLALSAEERNLEEVLELAPTWSHNLLQLGLVEDSLKCRFLEALALWETGKLQKAAELFEGIRTDAASLGKDKLQAQAANNAAMVYGLLGDQEKALERSSEALPLFRRLEDRVGIVKLQWGMGNLLRGQGRFGEATEAFKGALREAEQVGLRGDVAALHLIVADLLIETKHEAQAEWEIRAALPIIEEEKMVPEGMAALTLLRESLRRRQINRQALRDLHGYFQDSG
jgi:tetratricopeptide (TPR) repeat protein